MPTPFVWSFDLTAKVECSLVPALLTLKKEKRKVETVAVPGAGAGAGAGHAL